MKTTTITLSIEEMSTIRAALVSEYYTQLEYDKKHNKKTEAYKKSAEQAKQLLYKIAKEIDKFYNK